MRWLNYQHLLYFWTVARTGSITAASRELFVSAPAISTQIKSLETMFGAPLFTRAGRGLELTAAGRKAYAYADQIFRLGTELRDTLLDEGRQVRLRVGLAGLTPTLNVARWLAPLTDGTALIESRVGSPDALAPLLRARELELVLTEDAPATAIPEGEHLARLDYALFARPGVVDLRRGYTIGLVGAPVLLPVAGTPLRTRIDAWFSRHAIRPHVIGEGDEGGVLLELARTVGAALPAPAELRMDLATVHGLEWLGPLDGVHADVFLTAHAALRTHPAVSRLVRSGAAAAERLLPSPN